MKYKLLIVDAAAADLCLLERIFRDDYDVITAESGTAGLEIMRLYDIALVISDQRMPGMSGIEFLKKAAPMRPHTVRIILTGHTDVGDLVDALNSGIVYKYITKPWVNTDLQQTVRRAIEHYCENKARSVAGQEIERLEGRIKLTVDGVVKAMRAMIHQKSSNLSEHCRRVSEYAGLIGIRFKLEPEEMEELIFASLLHELPNLRMPFEMDFNNSALSSEQHRVTQNAYEKGLQLIANVPDLKGVVEIIRSQHEHVDGTGFFAGLEGEKIPFLSRILAVANAYDDITSGRNPALIFDRLTVSGGSAQNAYLQLLDRVGCYDQNVLDALNNTIEFAEVEFVTHELNVHALSPGMTLAGDLMSTRDAFLLSAGQEVSESLMMRLVNLAEAGMIADHILVNVPVSMAGSQTA